MIQRKLLLCSFLDLLPHVGLAQQVSTAHCNTHRWGKALSLVPNLNYGIHLVAEALRGLSSAAEGELHVCTLRESSNGGFPRGDSTWALSADVRAENSTVPLPSSILGRKLGLAASPLSAFCRHTQMQQHIHSHAQRKNMELFSLGTGNLSSRKMVPIREICHCHFKQPRTSCAAGRGQHSEGPELEYLGRVITGPVNTGNERFPNQILGILCFNQVLKLQF